MTQSYTLPKAAATTSSGLERTYLHDEQPAKRTAGTQAAQRTVCTQAAQRNAGTQAAQRTVCTQAVQRIVGTQAVQRVVCTPDVQRTVGKQAVQRTVGVEVYHHQQVGIGHDPKAAGIAENE